MSVFDALATPVAFVLKEIHAGLSTFLPAGSGWAWGLAIVLLTITVRILLFPIFVKQIKSQRQMQVLSPKIKALQAKHKGDRETLNTELMKLYKEHGTNPISGCLPLLIQMPIFFALFRVMSEFRPKGADHHFSGKYGLPKSLIEQGAHAKVIGAPISASFNSSADFIRSLHGHPTTVKIVAAVMVVIMGVTTFLTQRQMMARTGAQLDPQQAQVQKIMLYILPLGFAFSGFVFPVGGLLYMLTTNMWSMGQQHWVIHRMPPAGAEGTPPPKGDGGGGGGGGRGGKGGGDREPRRPGPSGGGLEAAPDSAAPLETVPAGAGSTGAARSAASRAAAGSRRNKKRKGGRR